MWWKNGILLFLCFSMGEIPNSSWRIITTVSDSRQGTTIEDTRYKQFKDKLLIYTKITLPNGAEIKRDQVTKFGSGQQTFIIQYPDGSIKAGYLTQETIYSSRLKRTIRTRVYVGERMSSETIVTSYNLSIGDF